MSQTQEAIFKEQIHYTIAEHFHRQIKLRQQGIKVLSLFFIDRVDNYQLPDSIIRRIFTQAFNELKTNYAQKLPGWKDIDPEAVQGAYFASKRTKEGEIILEDSTSGESPKDKEAYNLIMKDKERLLSFSKPVVFIFSHSALKEEWDNPNVFQICTLNQTTSEMKKRQEIGRGVRLAVNQTGDRVFDGKINVLTVVANESYEKYVAGLQSELTEAYGTEGLPPKPANVTKLATPTISTAATQRSGYVVIAESTIKPP